jgi:hypothetical protein
MIKMTKLHRIFVGKSVGERINGRIRPRLEYQKKIGKNRVRASNSLSLNKILLKSMTRASKYRNLLNRKRSETP